MSQSDPDHLEQYRGTAGAEVKTADVSGDDHPLKGALGTDDEAKERVYDAKLAGERFVQFYDDSAAAIREYLSNAETACIRRARNELLESGFSEDDIPSDITGVIEMAKEEVGYEPLIEVTYNRKSDETRLIIEDNGIGISVEEYQVLQRIGYSTSHDEGGQLGNFGMGFLSGFQLTSVNGLFRMFTKSYLTDEAYGTVEYVANCEFLDVAPSEYGTRFEFPGFGEAAKEIDIPSKVEEYADGMTIPVLYRDFDESGQETHRSDDFLATHMEDDYDDDSMVVIYEDEYFKAVMSPDSKVRGRGLTTYNISMPIRRNTDEWGSEPKFEAPWKWDYRGKKENGPIVHCPSDESLVGMVPKEDTKYDRLIPDLQEKCVPMSSVPDDAIKMPEPASSRDSFKSGHDDFWNYVSERLMEEWADIAKEHFEGLDSWDKFLDKTREEKEELFRAYRQFGPGTVDNDPSTIQDALEESLDVTVPKSVCERLDMSQSKVYIVRRDHHKAHTKGATSRKKIWEVVDEAPDGVYMGKSISQKKAEIAWNLGDTHVVRLEDATYTEMENDWGWDKLKDLPSRNLKQKLPELDDDVAEKWENASTNSGNTSGGTASSGGNGKDPETYRIKVRVGSRSYKYISTHLVSDLVDTLEDDEEFKAGHYRCNYLVIYEDSVSAVTIGNRADKRKDIATAGVPEYVYEYLEDQKNVYTSKDELIEERAGVDVTLSDGTTMCVTDLPETDCLIKAGNTVEDYFDGRPGDLVDALGYDSDEFDRFTWLDRGDLADSWGAETDATVIKLGGSFYDFTDYDNHNIKMRDLRIKDQLGDVDTKSEEYKALFGHQYGHPSGSKLETLIDIAAKAGIGD